MDQEMHRPRRRQVDEQAVRRWREKLTALWRETEKRVSALAARPRRIRKKLRRLARDKRGNRFPESEHGAAQLLLFAWGSLPQAGARLRESLMLRRKRTAHTQGRIRGWLEALRLHPAVFLGGAMVIAAAAMVLSFYTIGTAVTYAGADMGAVSNEKTVRAAVADVEEATRRALGGSYSIDPTLITSRKALVARRDVESQTELEARLTEEAGLIDYGYVLYVDGVPVAATAFSGALEELLEQMKIGYITPSTVECGFAEQVEIREEYVSRSYMMNLGYIAELLNDTKAGEVTYTVVAGDTYYGVAAKYDLTLSELMNMNPGYNVNMLHVGDVLTVSEAVPYLTVVDVERQSGLQDVPYSVTYQDDDTMYQGEYRVLSAGVYGKADVTANVTYINGTETGRQIVASVMLTEPVAEVQARGTKERPSWLPTGVFRWPCAGVITSYFGYRNTGIPGASTYHKGLDIANGYGTTVYASDGGTVTHSGWMGSYGYLVIIDHGNGYKTYYGHNSSLLVSVGAHVYQGQAIARMGSTGVSSGNHCHFGIMVNGTFVNPLNYLR